MGDGNVVIIGYIEVDPADRARWLELVTPLVEKTRHEEGALDYAVGPDLVEPNRIILYERYTGPEALQAHMASDHFKEFIAAARDIPITGGPHNTRFYQGGEFSYGPSPLASSQG